MKWNKKYWNDTTKRLRKLIEDNQDTHYLKQTCDKDGVITSLGFYANTEAEKQAEIKRKEEEEIQKQKEQEKLEKSKKYLNFLKENGYTVETKVDFHIIELDNEYILYKKVARLKK
jgi:hypothetical protein